MAKKKTLKERIDALVNALGRGQKPSFAEIRSELIEIGGLAEALENEQALAEKDARIADLETELGNLQVALQTASAEIEAFRAERKKQEEEKRREDIPEIQLKILSRLPSRHSGKPMNVEEIARAINIPIDETEVHINKLKSAGLVVAQRHNFIPTTWRRSSTGNDLVIARRLAGEEEAADAKIYKYSDLPSIQHEILLLIAAGANDGANENDIAERLEKTLGLIRFNLKALEAADMAGDPGEPDYGTGTVYYLRDKGAEYLAERDLL